jgi:hypothetical protein
MSPRHGPALLLLLLLLLLQSPLLCVHLHTGDEKANRSWTTGSIFAFLTALDQKYIYS